jgi:hypothetical protein
MLIFLSNRSNPFWASDQDRQAPDANPDSDTVSIRIRNNLRSHYYKLYVST